MRCTFIEVKDISGEEIIININNISIIWEHGTIVMNGTHGNNNGLLYLDKESTEKLLNIIKVGE